jgi:hypothetical protein
MSKSKPASLALAFAAKGQARPVDATKPVIPAATATESPAAASTPQPPKPVEKEPTMAPAVPDPVPPAANLPMATKSLTVKVDLATYTKLKAHGGAQGGKTNQDIFVEALGLYFQKYGIK